MKCQRHIANILSQDHVWSTEVSSLTGLRPVLDPVVRRRSSLFGHVASLPEDTPAHQALRCHIDLVGFQTRFGGDVQAALGTGGFTNSTGTTVHLLLTSGDQPSIPSCEDIVANA